MTTLNPQAQQLLAMLEASGQPTMDQLSPPQARIAASQGLAMLQGPNQEVAEVRDLKADTIPMRLYRPAGSQPGAALPALVYFHGGGWVIGDIELYDGPCRQLCNASGCAVVSVDYRLAPEYKFPAAVEDAYAATQWVAANASSLGIDATRLAVGGDSAGGNLAAVVSLLARNAGGPVLKFQLLIYPATDARGETASHQRNKEGYFLTEPLMKYFLGHYLRSEGDKTDWRMSPLLARSHADLPPAYVLVCGFDPLLDDGLAYADALEKAGVAVSLRRFDDQIHGFTVMGGVIPAANTAAEEMGAALRRALA